MIRIERISYLCSHLADQISLASVADLIEGGLSSPQMWFVKAEESLEIPTNTLSKYALTNVMLKGYSLQIRQAQNLNARFSLAKSLVEKQIGRVVNLNIYLTPPHSKALPLHSDDYDVLVYQASGEKLWSFAQEQQLPLTPGDAFYLKQGILHEAITAEHFSLHFTFGITDDASDNTEVEDPFVLRDPVISSYARLLRSRLRYSSFNDCDYVGWVATPQIKFQDDLIIISVCYEGDNLMLSLPVRYRRVISDFLCLKKWRAIDLQSREHEQLTRYLVKVGVLFVS